MAELYHKGNHDYFPDFADRTVRGVDTSGNQFNIVTKNITSKSLKWENYIDGVKNPRWRALVRQDVDASTSMTATYQSVEAHRMAAVVITSDVSGYAGNWKEYRHDGYPSYDFPSFSDPTNAVLSSARNQALRKFIQRVNEARTSLEGGQVIGEWKETIGAITNPLGALRKFALRHVINAKKRLRRIKNSHGGRTKYGGRRQGSRSAAFATAMSDTYLEFVFGWVPLAKDITAGVIGLLERYDQADRSIIKAKAVVGYNEASQRFQVFNTDNIECTHNRLTVSSVDYRFRAGIRTGAVNGVRSVPATLGLLPERFIPTVWELIPYSFVVDYFVNIGDIIESYAFRRSSIIWGTRTIRTKAQRFYSVPSFSFLPTPPNYYPNVRHLIQMGATGGDATLTVGHVDRVPISQDYLMPDLEFHLPISSKPWVNLGALLTSKFCSLF